MLDLIKNRMENEFCVLVDEEYGYRLWFWFPLCSADEVVEAWEIGGPDAEYELYSVLALGGDVIRADSEEAEDFWWACRNKAMLAGNENYAHVHEPEDTFLVVNGMLKIAGEEPRSNEEV